ncbi:MAG: aldehyde ferredoxin oxidoreductase N-terminal domain-containing protein [Chloroflexota bacterium]
MTEYGYAGEILKIDLSGGKIGRIPTAPYAEKFLGGRGIAARLYWEMVPVTARPFDPENCLIYMTGPMTGFTRLSGACRWQVCGKSPVMDPEAFSYANLGEKWGIWLKQAGYDGLVVQGRAARPAYIYINDGTVEIRDATALWGRSAFEAGDTLKAELGNATSVLTIGPAAENGVAFATMITDDGASGASGLGSVMGSKNLKAIVVAGSKRPQAADPSRLEDLASRVLELRKDTWKGWLNEIPGTTRKKACYGCVSGCFRKAYMENGRRYKFFCQAAHVYWAPAEEYGDSDHKVALRAMRLCDRYGLDTTIMQPMIQWLADCYKEGVLTEAATGLPLSRIGSAEFIEELTRQIAYKEVFGELLSRGTLRAAEELGERAKALTTAGMITRAAETRDYDPRLIPANALLYATEQRRPINQLHEFSHSLWLWANWTKGEEPCFLSYNDFLTVARLFWGGDAAADYTTYEGKALAAKKAQDRTYAKESLLLCDLIWPIIWVRFSDDHSGHPELEAQLLSAITGRDIDEAGLNGIGERIFNQQRAVLLRQGWGGRKGDRLLDYLHDEPLEGVFFNPDCIVPGKGGKVVSKKGNKVSREDFEALKDEYYALRGWDVATGLPTRPKLESLGLSDVADDLQTRGLLG